MPDQYLQHTFPNGLTILGEKMPGVHSAAMTLLVPAGSANDPPKSTGAATILSDLILRGAGDRDSRQLTDYLDSLGLQRSSSAGVHHSRLGCAALAARVMDGLEVYADIARRPHLPEPGFQAAKDLALQALEGIEDEPRQKVLIKLRENHFPFPYGRNSMGKEEEIEQMTLDIIKSDFRRRFCPNGAIFSIAGNIEFARVKAEVEKYFGDWTGKGADLPIPQPIPASISHEDHQSEQTQIGIAYPAIAETHPDYYTLRLATEVLSGGMSGRLFTEVREKRGLVYNVWAGYSSLKDFGSIMGYAGTSNDRAQATLDQFIIELYRLSEGISAAELDRAKTGLKAATIMQGESTSARAGAIAHDFFTRGRIRTLDEIKDAIDSVSLEQVNAYLKANPPGPFTVVTVGPKPLKVNLP